MASDVPIRRRAFGACGRRQQAGVVANWARVLVALYFAGGALFNAVRTLPNASTVFEQFAQLSWPGFEWLVRRVALPLAGPVTVAVVLFELATALLVLGRGQQARVGLGLAAAWHFALVPFLGSYAVVNVVVGSAIAMLLRYGYEDPPVRFRRSRQQA